MLPSNINSKPARTRSGLVKHQIIFSMASPHSQNTQMSENHQHLKAVLASASSLHLGKSALGKGKI
jgi:hypothetical protein